MTLRRRHVIIASLAASALPRRPSRAAAPPGLKIGVLTDLSGPYGEIAGHGSISCARQAVADFAQLGTGAAFDIQVVSADHRNDPARGASIASHWYDADGVDLIIDVPNSDVALAVASVAREKNRAYINCGSGTPLLTGEACSPNTIHWSYDTRMLAKSTGGAVVRDGGTTWYFVTADYAFGTSLEQDTSRFVIEAGGRIQGTSAYKFPGTKDFAPFLREAAQSGALVLGLANAGADVTACVRQARAIGVADQMRIACLLMQIPDVHLLGLDQAGGLLLTESFYWDMNDRTRAFTKRLLDQQKPQSYPDMIQAGCYAGTLHFLKAVAAMGIANAKSDFASVIAKMKAMPTDDDAFGAGSIRRDGRAMFPAFLFRVKTAAESSGPWDYYQLVSTTAPEDAFRPLAEGGCPMVRT